jgi:molybdenum cofactor synthesis domain-containing protein
MGNNIRAVVVSISDTRNESNDISGDRLRELLEEFGASVLDKIIVTDEFENLRQTLYSLSETDANLIITTGGTGLSPRDNTPEATLAVVDKEVPGISEAIRRESAKHTKFAMISRGVAGTRNGTLIINLPGSTKGVEQCFEVVQGILEHSADVLDGTAKHC